MNSLKILRIPGWLLFILILIVPASFPSNEIGEYLQVGLGFLLVVWIIKVDEELYLRIKGIPSIKFNLLVIGLIFTFLYMSIIILMTNGYQISTDKDNFAEYGWRLYFYIPGSIIALISYLYALHFVAYSIHVLDEQLFGRKTDYALLLLAIFFYPIGVWWIQPKINRILRTNIEQF